MRDTKVRPTGNDDKCGQSGTHHLQQHFDFRLAGIIKQFDLRFLPSLHRGKFYQQLAAYGHMGRQELVC